MYTCNNMSNYGYLTTKLPESLFTKLSSECAVAKTAKYNPEVYKNKMISGLTGNGVPVHYLVEDTKQELDAFAMNMFGAYEFNFKYLSSFRSVNMNMGYTTTDSWINIQEKYEHLPAHGHDGIVSYVIWIKIPYDIKEELKSGNTASCFSFNYNTVVGSISQKTIPVSKDMEGTIMMFPSTLVHEVYPFYTSDDVRISVSGNIIFDANNVSSIKRIEK